MSGQPLKRERKRRQQLREFRHATTQSLRSKHMCKWQDPDELDKEVRNYFEDCDRRQVSYTNVGLAMWLGFATRQSMADNCGRDDECGEVFKRAMLRIEQQRAEQLVDSADTPPQAKIFDLKVNFGWQEPPQQQEINNPDGNLGNKVVAVLPERPPSLEEWQSWYDQMMGSRSDPEPIDASYTETDED